MLRTKYNLSKTSIISEKVNKNLGELDMKYKSIKIRTDFFSYKDKNKN